MPPLRVAVVTEDGSLAELETEWRAVLEETPAASGFQSLAWVSACRRLPARARRLFVVVVREGNDTIAIFPTELGSRGDLCFIGERVSNYHGPVYRAGHLADVTAAFADFVDAEREVRLVDFRGLREQSPFLAAWTTLPLDGWGEAGVVRTATCPYVDLSAGWRGVYGRRRSSSRTQFGRKWNALGKLGRLAFVETTEPEEIRRTLPTMFRLFRERWAGRHESAGFAGPFRAFHEHAAPRLAAEGHVRLSLLRLDGDVIAFCYGITGSDTVSSYVLAHSPALGVYSPGSLLLLRLLEAACARGDAEYDFSLGEESYKADWATGSRGVFRALRWRRGSAAALAGSLRVLGSRAWVAARSVDWIRELRRDGLRRRLRGRLRVEERLDAPGLPAGEGRAWHVVRVETAGAAGEGVSVASWTYDDMRRAFSPRLLELALERRYRNDTLLVLHEDERLLGVVWRCCPVRRSLVVGGRDVPGSEPVYYHPVPAAGRSVDDLVRTLARTENATSGLVVVAREVVAPTVARPLGRFVADDRFKRAPARLARLAASGRGVLQRVGNASRVGEPSSGAPARE